MNIQLALTFGELNAPPLRTVMPDFAAGFGMVVSGMEGRTFQIE